ncbi:hypothetical protein [Streptomyces sp. AK02-04a]|uniref:hypothetical protein n=1 Tax=Streptomyces sp. AK02-04a TaxID=3028649 RepID=UPI0029BA79DE|nr:hypothetical protein [Streptomyces sp. AK02-04a]MDX3759466.1 hypothetical protein [Streptomyces sp. AK02-04a]
MQWTNGSGEAYGEDPYGGAGHAYAYGHDGYGHEGYNGDTAALTRDPVQLAQWTQPHPTAWDAAHGDVLTVAAPETDTQPVPFVPVPARESEPDLDTPGNGPMRPVFVDSSERRQRLVLRVARLLVIPAGGYVALLISTMLGGPGISAPFVPQPDTTHRAAPRATASDSPSGTGHSAGSTSSTAAHDKSGPTAQRTSSPVRPTASTAPVATSGPTAAPTRTTSATATASPTPTPAPAPSSQGRALGTSHKPVK